jgi:hypothetical protein
MTEDRQAGSWVAARALRLSSLIEPEAVRLRQVLGLADTRAGEHGPLRLRREVHALPATAQ